MQVKEYIQHAYDYTYWANRRYLAVADGLPEKTLLKQQGHSWGSVLSRAAAHAEFGDRLAQALAGRFAHGPSRSERLPNPDGRQGEVARGRARDAPVHRSADRGEPDARRSPTPISPGRQFHVPLWQMLMHVPNHETHHRGELAAMFALMKVPHPEEEVIQYFLDLSGQKKA